MARYVIKNGKIQPYEMPKLNVNPNRYQTDNAPKMGREGSNNKALATLENMFLMTGKGTVNRGEEILDFLNSASGKVNSMLLDWLGHEDVANKQREIKRNFIERNLTQELGEKTGISNRITENENSGSLVTRDNLLGQTFQAVGGMLPTIGVGKVAGVGKLNSAIQSSKLTGLSRFGATTLTNLPTTTTLAVGSYGGALQEAYLNGATEEEATLYAIGSTATEIATEWITGGIPGTSGKGGLDSLVDKHIDKISNKLVKDLTRYGYKMLGEGTEEAIAEIISPYLKNATYSENEQINWNDVLNSTIVGALSAGIIDAPSTISNISNDIKQNRNNISTVNDIVSKENNVNIEDNKISKITEQLEEYHTLQEQNKLTKEQQREMLKLEEQLNTLQNEVATKGKLNLSNVSDIVAQEQSEMFNSNQTVIPIMNDFEKYNINGKASENKSSEPQNGSFNFKQEQLNIIQNTNPMKDNYHTGIRSVDDIKTYEETLEDVDYKEYYEAGEDFDETYSVDVVKKAIETGKITVYSSYPIKQGTFVSPSRMEAESYSGTGKIYSKEVKLTDVAWIDPTQGQYAKVNNMPIKQAIFMGQTNEQIRTKLNDTINLIYKGIMPTGNQILFIDVPPILTRIGVKNVPFLASPNTIRNSVLTKEEAMALNYPTGKNENYHGLGVDGFNEVLDDLYDPVAIIKENSNKIIVLTEQFDYKNNQIIVPIEINTHTNYNTIRLDANVVLSAHGRTSIGNYLNNLLEKNAKIVYKNTKKIQNLIDSRKVQYPESIGFVSDNNIPQSNNNVKSGTLPITNNTQNNENNTINMPPVENKIIPQDPTREQTYEEPEKLANILEERPVTTEEKDSWLKKLLSIKTLDKGYYVDKLARQTNNRELSSKYDYMLMANGVAQQIIGNERFNPKTQKSEGKGLYKIFEPIDNSGKLQEFSEYIYHKHNVSRMSLNTLFQEDNKPIFGDSISSDTSKNIVEKYESENPEFIEWAQEIYDYNNFLLDVLVDYGVISSDDKAYYNKKYPYYVPTIRANDKTKVQMDFIGKKASINSPIKVAKGGNQDIIPLKEAMALRTMQTMNSALRNNFGNELLNTIEAEAETNKINIDEVVGDDIDIEDFLTKSTNKKPATLTIFKNGDKITFDISDEIYEALMPSQRYKFKIPNTISKLRRALITEYNPAFMLTNPIKDVQDGTLNSKHPKQFLKNIAEATKQISTKGDYYKLYLANGGSYETYFNYGEGYNKMPTKRGALDPRRVLDKISQVNQSIEMTPRLAEFISSLEAGDSIETAMYNAQEITTNFKRGGDWTKNLDANGVTFLNASVQGTVKQIRNFQEARAEGIRGMTNLAVKWSIAGLTPYILSQLIWGDDDEYEELSDYVKNNYYILWKNNDGTFVRIPKGRVVSVIQNLFKQPLDSLKGEKIDVGEFVDLLQNQVLPSDPSESNIISPLLDVAQNKTWYGGDLVPQRLQSLPEEEQYDESTDSISIWLGQKLGISPIKINYILDQYSGAIGDMILPTLTLEAENDSNSFLSNVLSPLKDKFTTDSVMNNQNISDLYDLDDELTKKSKSSNATTEDILKSKYINSIQTEMNKLTAEKRNIQNDKTLTNNEKYKQVREIQKQINELAKKGLNNYEKVKLYDNYAKVGDIEYYKNSSDEWQKLDTTTSKYKTIKQITTYDKYLTYQNKIDDLKDKYDNTTQRKNAVIKYVNSLNLSIPQKAMLIKLNYSSFNSYNKQIVQYINKQDLTKAEKTEILTKLGFTVKDGRVYY